MDTTRAWPMTATPGNNFFRHNPEEGQEGFPRGEVAVGAEEDY